MLHFWFYSPSRLTAEPKPKHSATHEAHVLFFSGVHLHEPDYCQSEIHIRTYSSLSALKTSRITVLELIAGGVTAAYDRSLCFLLMKLCSASSVCSALPLLFEIT